MTQKPTAHHNFPTSKYPIKLRLYSGTTGEMVWSHTITLDEALSLAKVEIPCYAGTAHYPVRSEIEYADGTIDAGGMS